MLSDLHRAVRSADPIAARRALRGLTGAGGAELQMPDDEQQSPAGSGLLEALAEMAGAGGPGAALATELLIETLDASGMVRRFAHQALLDQAAVDDVTQDSLISIAESIGSFRGGARVSTWVHRIVRNRVVDHLRRQRATAPLPADDVGPGERMSSQIATRATITEVLNSLPDQYRRPVLLRDVQGLAYAEVAEELGLGLSATKSRIARGRALVAARWRGPHQRADEAAQGTGAGRG